MSRCNLLVTACVGTTVTAEEHRQSYYVLLMSCCSSHCPSVWTALSIVRNCIVKRGSLNHTLGLGEISNLSGLKVEIMCSSYAAVPGDVEWYVGWGNVLQMGPFQGRPQQRKHF